MSRRAQGPSFGGVLGFSAVGGSAGAAGPVAVTGSGSAIEVVGLGESGRALRSGARQEFSIELLESYEPDGSSGLVPAEGGIAESIAEGDVYTWQDGDRTLRARLLLDLVVVDGGSIVSKDDVVVDAVGGPVVRIPGAGAQLLGGKSSDAGSRVQPARAGALQPVFRSDSGELMTLPGDIAVMLDPAWDSVKVAAFFARNGIDPSRVSELDYLTNGFVVETSPGFPALNLANALAGQSGVEFSSPNWWRERFTR